MNFHRPAGYFRHAWLLRLLGKTVHDLLEDAATQIRVHKFFTFFWLCNMIVATSVFYFAPGFWNKFSIFYIVFISLYANFATDYDALSASQASLHGGEARDTAAALHGRLSTVEWELDQLKHPPGEKK